MARNAEKANTVLARFLKAQQSDRQEKRRPALADQCGTLGAAEKWRRQVIKEITKAVTVIQNAALGEHRIRDLNDKINKLLREKKHWERRIKELNGPDYADVNQSITTNAISSGGYMYFGAAKDLPGVREQLEVRKKNVDHRRKRWELHRLIDYDYFGFGDDDDGLLIEKENIAEKKAIEHKVNLWKEAQRKAGKDGYIMPLKDDVHGEVTSFVSLPSAAEIRKEILRKKKEEILKKYTEDTPEARLLAAHDNLTTAREDKENAV